MIFFYIFTMFKITHYDDKYFASPTLLYNETFGDEIINNVCPKYSYGARNSLAICELFVGNNEILLSRFTNYYLLYCNDNNIEYEKPYKGLGLELLYNVILQLLKENKITEDYIFKVATNISNKKLVEYYKSLSFDDCDNKSLKTTIKNFLNKVNYNSNSSNFAFA